MTKSSFEQDLFYKIIRWDYFFSIELELSPECNLNCRYCYMKRFNKGKKSPVMNKETIDQSILLFKKLKDGQRFTVELFGGEPFLHPDLIEYVCEKTNLDDQVQCISIPNNGYFISQNYNYTYDLLQKYPKLVLSFSVDGEINENFNRPQRPDYSLQLDYDSLFKLQHNYPKKCGFHPMIYAPTAHNTYKMFTWFLKNMKKDHQEQCLYLLPVRNWGDWNKNQIDSLITNLNQCIEYLKANNIPYQKHGFNIFTKNSINRGLTCSLQTSLFVNNQGDLHPCHRLQYPQYKFGSVYDYPNWKYERILPFYIYHRNNILKCQSCSLSNTTLCLGGCLGAQYEYWKDPFIPLPEVCSLIQALKSEVYL
jgi:uncharacterized protein